MINPEMVLREATFHPHIKKVLDEVAQRKGISRSEAAKQAEVQRVYRVYSEV